MATEVLRPQDVLPPRFRVPYPRRRDFSANGPSTSQASNQNYQRRPSAKHEKKRSTMEMRKPNQGGDPRRRSEIGAAALAVGKVTLLRRGESLNSLATKIGGSNPTNSVMEDPATIRARSDSELLVTMKVRKAPPPKVDVYAGAAFESSPSPRSLPLPTFFSKKGDANEAFEDGATRSLRRMLRLE